MPLGDPYATLLELKARLGITDDSDNAALNDALAEASRGVEKFCRRQFNKAEVASARVYYPTGSCVALVDDFHTTTDLVVKTDVNDDGTFETTWASSDFQLEPLNGIVEGEEGWPFWRVRAVRSRTFPLKERASVEVTAQWGWDAVPAQVKGATLILAEELFKLKDAPFGVAGFGDLGVVRVRENPAIARKLTPYQRTAVRVA